MVYKLYIAFCVLLDIAIPMQAFNKECLAFSIFGALVALKNNKAEQEKILKAVLFVATNAAIGYMGRFVVHLVKPAAEDTTFWLACFLIAFFGTKFLTRFGDSIFQYIGIVANDKNSKEDGTDTN